MKPTEAEPERILRISDGRRGAETEIVRTRPPPISAGRRPFCRAHDGPGARPRLGRAWHGRERKPSREHFAAASVATSGAASRGCRGLGTDSIGPSADESRRMDRRSLDARDGLGGASQSSGSSTRSPAVLLAASIHCSKSSSRSSLLPDRTYSTT